MTGRLMAPVLLLLWMSGLTLAARKPAGPRELPLTRVVLYANGAGYFEYSGTAKASEVAVVTIPAAHVLSARRSLWVSALDGERVGFEDCPTQERAAAICVHAEGTGAHRLQVGYVAETAPWEAFYRLSLNTTAPAQAELQVSALVSNRSGRDWSDVKLSLARNAPREILNLLSSLISRAAPPTNTSRASEARYKEAALWGRVTDADGVGVLAALVSVYDSKRRFMQIARTEDEGVYVFDSLQAPAARLRVDAQGFTPAELPSIPAGTNGMQRCDVKLSAAPAVEWPNPPPPELRPPPYPLGYPTGGIAGGTADGIASDTPSVFQRALGNALENPPGALATTSAKSRQVLLRGDLVVFDFKEAVSLPVASSARLPMPSIGVEALPLFLSSAERVTKAVRLIVRDGEAPPDGALEVIEGSHTAGAGRLNGVRVAEPALIEYAVEDRIRVAKSGATLPRRFVSAQVRDSVLTIQFELAEQMAYAVTNHAAEPRAVLLEHLLHGGYVLRDTPPALDTTAEIARFRVDVMPHSAAGLSVKEVQLRCATVNLRQVPAWELKAMANDASLPGALRSTLAGLLAKQLRLETLERELRLVDEHLESVFNEQYRLRENLSALSGHRDSAALSARYRAELAQQDEALVKLRARRSAMVQEMIDTRAAWNALLEQLDRDYPL